MARKTRRIFDIDMPQDLTEDLGAVDAAAGTPSAPEGQSFPAGKVREDGARPKRRGPMATAIGEAAASSRERQQAEA